MFLHTITKYMESHSRKKQLDFGRLYLLLDNALLQRIVSFKYLGVMVDSHVNLLSHISKAWSKLAYGCHTLLKSSEWFGGTVLHILYFEFVHSYQSYSIESWGGTYKTNLKSISHLQKRAIRIITFSYRTDAPKQLFQLMPVLRQYSLYIISAADIILRIIKHDCPFPLSTFILPARCSRAAENNCFNSLVARKVYGQRPI